MRWIGLLFTLALNAIPLYGVRYLGWSASTVVALYWAENLALAFFTCARIALHRTLTRKRGHWRGGAFDVQVNGKTVSGGLLSEYAIMAFPFTLVHGIFVAAFVFIGAENHSGEAAWAFSRVQFVQGLQWILAALALEFLVDALTMRRRSFAWIKAYVGQRAGRVLIMHFVLIIGMWAMMATESPFALLYVLIAIKTLWDVFSSNRIGRAQELPADPPQWAQSLADNVAKKQGGAAEMRRDWEQKRAQEIRNAREDEEVMPA